MAALELVQSSVRVRNVILYLVCKGTVRVSKVHRSKTFLRTDTLFADSDIFISLLGERFLVPLSCE